MRESQGAASPRAMLSQAPKAHFFANPLGDRVPPMHLGTHLSSKLRFDLGGSASPLARRSDVKAARAMLSQAPKAHFFANSLGDRVPPSSIRRLCLRNRASHLGLPAGKASAK